MSGLTRDEAREQVARAIHEPYCFAGATVASNAPRCPGVVPHDLRNADAALSVLWPEVERLRTELAHAHAVIARHVEPRREGEA